MKQIINVQVKMKQVVKRKIINGRAKIKQLSNENNRRSGENDTDSQVKII